jgi:serine/tyrosine/threonine adenylyltransferase
MLAKQSVNSTNPFLNLAYESAFASLGEEYGDRVTAAEFPQHTLRWRNDALLPLLGLNAQEVADEHFVEAFGCFAGTQPAGAQPCIAMGYHGYQFGDYNPQLGDGRGFLYGQVRGIDGELYDFGTKGSGRTPYSRTADGRLTLKGGVREVLAAEMLHRLGVRTSRCLSLVETGEDLWRGDEPSPTRSSVMVRFSRSHIRFGTFERLHFLGRPDLTRKMLDHVIEYYYPHLTGDDRHIRLYAAVVDRVATLAAQWMVAGFCHGVLNTDNMSMTGESFDYGPYAFINTYDPKFTAAYFDYYGRYCYGNQPEVCVWNLQMLQVALKGVVEREEMEAALGQFYPRFRQVYRDRMLGRLGLELGLDQEDVGDELVRLTLRGLWESQVGYHEFFLGLRRSFSAQWREDETLIFGGDEKWADWRRFYFQVLNSLPAGEMGAIAVRLAQQNPTVGLVRSEIERVWEAIDQGDDWGAFYGLVVEMQEG